LTATLAGNDKYSVRPHDGDQNILALDQDDASNHLPEIVLPEMSDQLSILGIFALGVGYNGVAQQEAHEIAVFETDVAAFVLGAHHCAADFVGLLLADQMAGRFELFKVWGEVETEYLSPFAEGKEDVVLLEMHEFLNISSFGLTLAYHLVFVYVQEVDLSKVSADNEGVAFVLEAESSHVGGGVHFLDGQGTGVVEVAIYVALKDSYLAIITGTEDHLFILYLLCQDVGNIEFMLIQFLHKHPVFQFTDG
jgi:hypothetical protein